MEEGKGCMVHDSVCNPRYKRRMISAKRDFPPGCGRKVSQINVAMDNDLITSLETQRLALKDESRLVDVVSQEFSYSYSTSVERKKLSNGADSFVVNVSLPSALNSTSQPENPDHESIVLVKNLKRKYPPRRIISAIRHFPQNFARDVPQHTAEECIGSQVSSNFSDSSLGKVEDMKSNISKKCSSVGSERALNHETNFSYKIVDLPTINAVDNSKDVKSNLSGKCSNVGIEGALNSEANSSYKIVDLPTINAVDNSKDMKSNLSGKCSSVGIEGILNTEANSSYKFVDLPTINAVDNSKDEKSNLSGTSSSVGTEGALNTEANSSYKIVDFSSTDVVDHSKDGSRFNDANKSQDMSSCFCESTDKNSRGTSHVAKCESENNNVDPNVKLQISDRNFGSELIVCDAKNNISDQCLDNNAGAEGDVPAEASSFRRQHLHASGNSGNRKIVLALKSNVHNEDKSLLSEGSCSSQNVVDTLNSKVLSDAPVSMEIVNLEDENSREERSSIGANNKMIVLALMAAPNCPWSQSKVVHLSSHNSVIKNNEPKSGSSSGKKKRKVNKLFKERRALSSVSKRRKATTNDMRTTPLTAYPYVTVMESGGREMTCKQDEGCDELYASRRTHEVDLSHIMHDDQVTVTDSDDEVSDSKVRDLLHRYQTVFNKLMQKDAVPVRGAMGFEEDDHALEKRLVDLGDNNNTCKQNLGSVPVQPELGLNVIKKSRKSVARNVVCIKDISEAKESIPVRAVNNVDDEQPPSFKYITSMVYPDWCRPLPLRGCNCSGDCSDSLDCACAVLNGGEIPFNNNGCIIEVKKTVYECGPSCSCPSSCPNRVSQFGIRFQLEIFKTESRGWGVRSRNFIPSGGFVCEYLGELLEDKQAEQRIYMDEYLFDLIPTFSDQDDMEVIYDACFTIDARKCGNIGRFVNHSCSPNMYAQKVLYDHENVRIPHIMFFASEDIPPLQELTYDYNYTIGGVFDANGNVKIKQCFCGSEECRGRLY